MTDVSVITTMISMCGKELDRWLLVEPWVGLGIAADQKYFWLFLIPLHLRIQKFMHSFHPAMSPHLTNFTK